MFFRKKKIHDFSLLSIGARNQIWIYFQGDADAHTRGSVGTEVVFKVNIKCLSFKGHCARKKLSSHCQTFTATTLKYVLQNLFLSYTANITQADYYARVLCLCVYVCVCACMRAHARVCVSERSCAIER